jgi:hypothetical protein
VVSWTVFVSSVTRREIAASTLMLTVLQIVSTVMTWLATIIVKRHDYRQAD